MTEPALDQTLPEPPKDAVPPPDEHAGVSPEQVVAVREALAAGDLERAAALVSDLHAADAAALISQLDDAPRQSLVEALRGRIDAEVLASLEGPVQEEVLEQLGPEEVASAVAELETDDAVQVVAALDEARRDEVLEAVPSTERTQIEQGLAYPEESAGRLMQGTFIAMPEFWSVGQAIDYLRDADDLPDEFYELFVTDPDGKPLGTIPLNRFLKAKRHVVLRDILDTDKKFLPTDMDQEEVAYQFQQYDMPSAGVVDERGRLVGVIMIDDVVDVVREEVEEDLLALSGVSEAGFARSVRTVTRARFPWLFANVLTAFLAAAVIGFFEGTIEQMVAAAVLMPIVASMGGNAGNQTVAVAVRAIATHSLTPANAGRIVLNELLVGGANGVIFAVLVGVVGGLWFGQPELGFVFGLAMFLNLLAAALAGILVPLGLARAGVDPAVSSSVFVTTVTDVVGFFAFLGLVTVLLL
ncbi:MAG: magnesium transporter [Alphaproteobacteria bacterium]|nr:magnesium transporter [Alphaproteobacteria bacterium]